jgi:hypothetical protein
MVAAAKRPQKTARSCIFHALRQKCLLLTDINVQLKKTRYVVCGTGSMNKNGTNMAVSGGKKGAAGELIYQRLRVFLAEHDRLIYRLIVRMWVEMQEEK